ncbi:MAG: DUF5011 domain-containing protein [Candidatus Pacebacteria bacterium]|nr:DUF5011 domain-containing protein [Candidatus Paceibacterota bacterium]
MKKNIARIARLLATFSFKAYVVILGFVTVLLPFASLVPSTAYAAGMTVSTVGVTNIGQYDATFSGTVTDPDNSGVSQTGVLYSLSPGTTYGGSGDYVQHSDTASLDYSLDMIALSCGTTYYYRAYVVPNDWWDYTSYPVGDEMSFTTADCNGGGGGGGTPTPPNITISSPTDSETVTSWAPTVNWDTSATCSYSYDGMSTTTVNCASGGSDIAAPSAGSATLYVDGVDSSSQESSAQVSFTYSPADGGGGGGGTPPTVAITSPQMNSTGSWDPIVDWGGAATCEYSYDNSTYTPVTCSNNGSDIPAPGTTGSATLYIEGADSLGDTSSPVSVSFIYDPTAPAALTGAATNITMTSVTLTGSGMGPDGGNLAHVGVKYATDDYYTNNGNSYNQIGGVANGGGNSWGYDFGVSGLSCGTTYHYQAYAFNDDGSPIGYGADRTFQTSPCPIQDGTPDHPYQITSCSDFMNIENNSGSDFVLENDIDCSGSGNNIMVGQINPFTGTFDGQGHAITVAINTNATNGGLFGYVNGGTIKNLRVQGTVRSTSYYAGALAGFVNGGTIQDVASFTDITGGTFSGGLAGYIRNATIQDAYASTTVDASTGSDAGGITGGIDGNSLINHVYARGSITGSPGGGGGTGGIAGYNGDFITSNSTITNSFSVAHVSTGQYVGAVLGRTGSDPTQTDPSTILSNDVFDIYRSGTPDCADNIYAGSSGVCVGVNDQNTDPNYFKNNDTNLPFAGSGDTGNDWDFTSTWATNSTGYPTLVALSGDQSTRGDNLTDGFMKIVVDSDRLQPILGATVQIACYNGTSFNYATLGTTDSGGVLEANPHSVYDPANCDDGDQVYLSVSQSGYTTSNVSAAFTYYVARSSQGVSDPALGGNTYAITLAPVAQTINSCSDLEKIGVDSDYPLVGNYTLAGDFDCSEDGNAAMIASSSEAPFTGSFDGAGHTITISLYNPSSGAAALFGYVSGASIHDLNVAGSVTGDNQAAGLVGNEQDSIISRTSSSVTVDAPTGSDVGSLIGYMNEGTTTDSYATGAVSGNVGVGGLVGGGNDPIIINSYATGAATGNYQVGGLFGGGGGTLAHSIQNVFATGHVQINGDTTAGGLSGNVTNSDTFLNSYYDEASTGMSVCNGSGDVSGCTAEDSSGFDGSYFYGSGNAPNNSWDFSYVWYGIFSAYPTLKSPYIAPPTLTANTASSITSNSATLNGSIVAINDGETVIARGFDWGTDETYGQSSFFSSDSFSTGDYSMDVSALSCNTTYHYRAFTNDNIGTTYSPDQTFTTDPCPTQPAEGNGYPADPYVIQSCSDLALVNNNLSSAYVLANDLDCTENGNDVIMGGADTPFTGIFDGAGHTITLDISGSSNYHALFADTNGATIRNLHIAGSVSGTGGYVAGLVGNAQNSNIYYVSSSASVTETGGGDDVGGLVGYLSNGTLRDSYATGDVYAGASDNSSSGREVGGLVGMLQNAAIDRTYATGAVTGFVGVGGLVGSADNGGSINDSLGLGTAAALVFSGGLVGSTQQETVAATLSNDGYANDTDVSCVADVGGTPDGCTGASAVSFESTSDGIPFAAWDFNQIWQTTEGYPTLRSPILAPIGYWPLDTVSDGSTPDVSDRSDGASLANSPTPVIGNFGTALDFNGDGQYAETQLVIPRQAGTLSLWANANEAGDWQSPAGWKQLNGNNGYVLIDEAFADDGGNHHWRAVFKPDQAADIEGDIEDPDPIVPGQWYHVAMTWTLAEGTYTVHLYVNGVDEGSTTWTGGVGAGDLGGFNIGKSGTYNDNFFNGTVDEVKVYDRALSPDEVTALADETPDPGTVSLSVTSGVTTPLSDNSVPQIRVNSNLGGTLTYGGSCSGNATTIGSGDTTIRLNKLPDGTYSDCTLTVTNSGVSSDPVTIPEFTVAPPETHNISSCEDLQNMDSDASTYADNFVLANNIDCTGVDFQPLSWENDDSSFMGTFDGAGYTISNLTIDQPGSGSIALFKYLEGGTVKNLTLDNVSVTGSYQVGSIAGQATNEDFSNITITGATLSSTSWNVGGVVGEAYYNDGISHAVNNILVDAALSNIYGDSGGLFGYLEVDDANTSTTISGITTSGTNIASDGPYGYGLGGIIGDAEAYGGGSGIASFTITDASSSMTVEDQNTSSANYTGGAIGYLEGDGDGGPVSINVSHVSATGDVSGGADDGGLVGEVNLYDDGSNVDITLDHDSATGNVTDASLDGSDNGGLIGHVYLYNNDPIDMHLTVSNSYATGNVNGVNAVGGLIGGTEGDGPGTVLYNEASTGGLTIENDYATGSVTQEVGDYGINGIGGLVGALFCESYSPDQPYACSVSKSYASGAVLGSNEYAGGLVGVLAGDVSVQDAYATGDVVGNNFVGGLVGLGVGFNNSLDIERTYASGAISTTGDSPYGIGGLAGGIGIESGAVSLTDSFSTADMNDVAGDAASVGSVIGTLDSEVNTSDLWYVPSAGLSCVGNEDSSDFCTSADSNTFFENSMTNGPLQNWTFQPSWLMNANQYPTFSFSLFNASAPVITLTGSALVTLHVGQSYVDAGATATDSNEHDITSRIVTVNPVDTSTPGTYTITYDVTDSSGNAATEVTRTVVVTSVTTQARSSGGGSSGGRMSTTSNSIASLQAQIAALQAELASLQGTTPSTASGRNLTMGMSGSDVKELQLLLIAQDAGSAALALSHIGATGYFSTYTRKALAEYQKAHSINPANGYFGSITRKQMKTAGLSGLWW